MYEKITIGSQEVEMVANAATAYKYKQVFNEDLLVFFMEEQGQADFVYVAEQLAFIMMKQAESNDFSHVSEDEYYTWLEQFDQFDFIRSGQQIINLFQKTQRATSKPKKKVDQQSGE